MDRWFSANYEGVLRSPEGLSNRCSNSRAGYGIFVRTVLRHGERKLAVSAGAPVKVAFADGPSGPLPQKGKACLQSDGRKSYYSVLPLDVNPTPNRKACALPVFHDFLSFSPHSVLLFKVHFAMLNPVARQVILTPSRRTEATFMHISMEPALKSGVRRTGQWTHLFLGRVSFGIYF